MACELTTREGLMKILIVGNGGREHALAWKAKQSSSVDEVFVAPGNAGTAMETSIRNIAIASDNIEELIRFAQEEEISLTIVGPEVPLVAGIVDAFQQVGLVCFGPTAAAAQLEGSKTFCKQFMQKYQIPTADYQAFTEIQPAIDYIENKGAPIVVKADGLAAGKGVIVAETEQQAIDAVKDMLSANSFGEAGHRVVIEEFLTGEEASFIVIADGEHALAMATSQDHKARDNGDKGPNTGGMGAYSPAPAITEAMHDKVMEKIIQPTLNGMKAEGMPYTGFLYAGLMIGPDGNIKVLEYNCRFGDPETQPIMMRLKSDLVALCLAAHQGQLNQLTTEWDSRTALGVVLASGGYPDSYSKHHVISGLTTAQPDHKKIFHAGTEQQAEQIVTSGGRVICACALGKDIEEAKSQAYQLAQNISWQDMFYRTDIGDKAINRPN